MKKNKNKKLKKQFKNLLHSHINKGLKEKVHINNAEPDIELQKPSREIKEEKNTSDNFATKDILKTVYITFAIIVTMAIISYFFNKNNLFNEAISFITKLFGGR